MNFRREQLSHFGKSIDWLLPSKSQSGFDAATSYSSNSHYGLDKTGLLNVERRVKGSDDFNLWLANRCDGQFAYVAYSPDCVFKTTTQFLLANWQDLFCPGRDDAITMSVDRLWVAFYCHEDEVEIGDRPAQIVE